MKNRHIIFIINSMVNSGGSERVTSNLANIFAKWEGCKVSIIALKGEGSFYELDEKISLLCLHSTSIVNMMINMVKIVNRLQPTQILGISINKLNIFLAFSSCFFKNRKTIKILACEHISFKNASSLYQRLKKTLYRKFDEIIVLTNTDQKIFNDINFSNVSVIPNFSNFDFFSENILDREKTILAVGHLSERKGFGRLIDIWNELSAEFQDWTLLIIGNGEQKKLLQDKIRNYNIEKNCKILPSTSAIDRYYKESQIYALTSYAEGLPMVMIEAMYFGIPLISYDCETGPREIIDDNVTGFLVEEGNSTAFIEKLRLLISDSELRREISCNVQEKRNKFSKQTIISLWENLLSKN